MGKLTSGDAKMILETTTTIVEYENQIIYLRLKEGAEIDLENTLEQYAAQKDLTKNTFYGVLVDARNFVTMDKASRNFMSAYTNPHRVATALLTPHNLATRFLANIYLKLDKPKIETKMFGEENEAVMWLKSKLYTAEERLKVVHTNTEIK